MPLDEGEKLQLSEIVSSEVDKALKKSIPRLVKLEAYAKPMIAIACVVIAAPLTLFGLKALVKDTIHDEFTRFGNADPDSPLVKLRAGFQTFSKGLQETFDGQVDSATFKMLRFGCNVSDIRLAPNFPGCIQQGGTGAVAQARSVVDEDEQTIAFAGRPAHQKVTLSLALRPVDPPDVLNRVALELEWAPLDVRTAGTAKKGRKRLVLTPAQVSKNKEFLLPGGNMLMLYGVADSMQDQPINLTIDVTDVLKEVDATLHQLRIRAVANPTDDSGKKFDGTERFFLRAVVSVNHRVQPP